MERILSLLPSTTEIAAALGLGDQLVGRSHECSVPPEVLRLPVVTEPKVDVLGSSGAIDARVKELVREGLSVYRVDAELLRALEPDVILTQTQCDVCAVTPRDLEDAACEWLDASPRLVAVEPHGLADVLDDLVRVAEGCGVGERGRRLREERWAHLEEITDRAARTRVRPRVACLEWIDPLMGAGSWIPELVERAGGRPELARAECNAQWTTLAELAATDPDVIVIQPCGFELARTRAELGPLVGAPAWGLLRAVREGRVALADGFLHLNRPGPRIGESLEILAEILHPGELDFGWRGRAWEPLA
jgi:iron complex transport system substrate-binding protein